MSIRLSFGTLDSMAGIFAPPKRYRLGQAGGSAGSGDGKRQGASALAIASLLGGGRAGRPSAQAKFAFGGSTNAATSWGGIGALARTARRVPEVMVRITGRQTGGGHVLANFEYISRARRDAEQHVPLHTSEGDVLHDPRDMASLATEWQDWEMGDDARRRGATSLSMILSMPGGTDPEGLRLAALDFAREEFANRSWVAALHVDRDHPHVHLTIARRDHDGRRFHPDREDLFRYRQRFAARLRDWGIEANATPARARGVDPKHDHIAAVKMRAKGQTPRLDRSRADRAERLQRESRADPVAAVIARQQAVVISTYQRSIDELMATGKPEALAVANSLKAFVETLPPPSSNAARAVAGRETDGQSPATRPGPDDPIEAALERARKMRQEIEAKMNGRPAANRPEPHDLIEAALERARKTREAIEANPNWNREPLSGKLGSRRLKAAIERTKASMSSIAPSASPPTPSIIPPAPSITPSVLLIGDVLREVQERDREVRDRALDREGPER